MPLTPTRRTLLLSTAMSLAATALRAGDEVIDIDWGDLVPGGAGIAMERLRQLGVVQHGQLSTPFDQETNAAVTDRYNGQRIRIPGYTVPIEFDGLMVTSFILVPYVGACIHVPPPPPNQLVLVRPEDPFEMKGLFEPVYVTGIINTMATETELAEIGYAMNAADVEPYG